ncbi:MAG: putative transposase [Myxococcota bacterium]
MSIYRFIDAERTNDSIRRLCDVLDVSRSAFHGWMAGEWWQEDRDRVLTIHIRAAHRASLGMYGVSRMVAELRAHGLDVGARRVARIMKQEGLSGVPEKRFRRCTTDSSYGQTPSPNLLNREFTMEAPNVAWVTDITYAPTHDGWGYLAVIIDVFSWKVVGWAMDSHMETSLCRSALEEAMAERGAHQGTMHHLDKGSQYARICYRASLLEHGFVQSMSRKADCWDNAVSESFFGTLEQEFVQGLVYGSLADAKARISYYIHQFYNPIRRHKHLGQMSPNAFEQNHRNAERLAA